MLINNLKISETSQIFLEIFKILKTLKKQSKIINNQLGNAPY